MSPENQILQPEKARERLQHIIQNPVTKDAPALWAFIDIMEDHQREERQQLKSLLDITNIIDGLSNEDLWRRIRRRELALLNDFFRMFMMEMPTSQHHRILCTSGVAHAKNQQTILNAIQSFDQFNEDCDPHGEHDFGKIIVDGESYFFKVDYYLDETLRYGVDPYENIPYHLFTIMRAEEY